MSALLGIWIASLVGAVLFFGTGFFLARSGTKGSLEQVRFQAQQTSSEQQQRARALESNLAQLHMHYEEERLRASQLTERLQAGAARAEALTHAQAECRRLEGELQALKQELSRAEPLGQDIGLLKHQVATLSRARSESEQRADARTREVADLKRKLALATNASTEWKGKAQKLGRDESAAPERAARASAALNSLEEQSAALREELQASQREQREVQVRNGVLTSRVSELQAYADENMTLRSEREFLSNELAKLKRSQPEPPPDTIPDEVVEQRRQAVKESGTTRRVTSAEPTLESHLERHLYRLVQREPGITAVLSDENGFPVVGVGPEHLQEGVSVLTSLAQELATRAGEFIDLDAVKQMELVDARGKALRVRFFTWQEQPLALGCVGVSHLRPNSDEEQVVNGFPRVLMAVAPG
jgi:hypothetical protein